jgi:hypothetical protein
VSLPVTNFPGNALNVTDEFPPVCRNAAADFNGRTPMLRR